VRALAKKGRTTLGAASAEEAVELLKTKKVFAMLTDINLPGMSGIELAKQTAAYPGIRIILSSGAGYMVADKIDFKFVFLPKPYNVDTLLAAIDECPSKQV
jgi:DNA-binding NtrC family response regulator